MESEKPARPQCFPHEVFESSMENFDMLKGSVHDLVDSSEGVAGLHLNGDVAPWGDLMEGGDYETWLLPLTDFKM